MTALAEAPVVSTEMRPYQSDAIHEVIRFVERGGRSPLIVVATGGGKTVLFSNLGNALELSHHEKILILVHRDELVSQSVEKYLRDNPAEMVGIEKANRRATPLDRVCVASVQTLQGARLEDFIARWGIPSIVITDEAHHAASPSYISIYKRLGIRKGGEILHAGFTATPKRGDGVGLDEIFEEVAYSISIEDLIAQGWLVDLRGFTVQTDTKLVDAKTGRELTKRDLEKADKLAEIVNTAERNAKIVRAYLDLAKGRKAVVFAANVEHSMELREHFAAAGVRAAHVDGTRMKIEDRKLILADFERGMYDVIVNAQTLTEGWDSPGVSCVILARPISSEGFYAQCVGRGTRLLHEVAGMFRGHLARREAARDRRRIIAESAKPDCIVIDVMDVSRKHQLVSLPQLLGLPPGFDLKGRSATKTARKFDALVQASAIVNELVHDADALDELAELSPAERLKVLIQSVRDTTQKYVAIDLLTPKPLPEWAQDAATMTWFAAGPNTFRLNLDTESVVVEKNLVGHFDVMIAKRTTKTMRKWPLSGSPYPSVLEAFRAAEGWVRDHRDNAVPLLALDAPWRSRPASRNQRGVLHHAGIAVPKGATGGDVSPIISQLRGEGSGT